VACSKDWSRPALRGSPGFLCTGFIRFSLKRVDYHWILLNWLTEDFGAVFLVAVFECRIYFPLDWVIFVVLGPNSLITRFCCLARRTVT